jgi:hypothetical protein
VALAALLLSGICLRGQEAVVPELPPIVVTGSFELRPAPSTTDLFTKYLENEIETKRAAEEAVSRSPFWNARFWGYIPLRLGAVENNSFEFLTPRYLSLDYLHTDQALRVSSKQSLFDAR